MKFMDVHNGAPGLTQEQLLADHQKDLEIQDQAEVQFLHAWADPRTGKVFCLSEAPSREAVEQIHAQAGHPADEIYELSIEV